MNARPNRRGRNLRSLGVVLLAFQVGLLSFIVLGTHGMIVPLDRPVTTDFVSFYAAGKLATEGTPELAYNQAEHRAMEERATEPGIGYQFFYYPPTFLLLCTLLARLPYLAAFVVFEVATGLTCLAVVSRLVRNAGDGALILALAFPAVFWTIGLGQNSFLSAALFGAATLFLDSRPIAAGLLFGALCYKPHLGLLVPVALIAGRRWKALGAGAISAAGLCAVSLAVFGPETWRAYLSSATGSLGTYEFGRIDFSGMISVFGAVRLIGGGLDLAYSLQAGMALAATVVTVCLWRVEADPAAKAAGLISATLLSVPVILLYDLTLAGVAIAWLARAERDQRMPTWQQIGFVAIFVISFSLRDIGSKFGLPLGPIPALILLAGAYRRAIVSDGCLRWTSTSRQPRGSILPVPRWFAHRGIAPPARRAASGSGHAPNAAERTNAFVDLHQRPHLLDESPHAPYTRFVDAPHRTNAPARRDTPCPGPPRPACAPSSPPSARRPSPPAPTPPRSPT